MPGLLQLLQTPGLGIAAVFFASAFLAVRLGHAVIGLLEAWEDYRSRRLRG